MQRLEELIGQKTLVAVQDGKEASYTVTLHGTEIGFFAKFGRRESEALLSFKVAKFGTARQSS
jgi:hypothetical protein